MRKRKFGAGGLNALDAPRDQSGAAVSPPTQIMQAPTTPPGQASLYASPAATFPRAQFKKGGKIKSKGKTMAKGNMSVGNVSSKTKVGFAKGGAVRSGIDGIASKGKTKGKKR